MNIQHEIAALNMYKVGYEISTKKNVGYEMQSYSHTYGWRNFKKSNNLYITFLQEKLHSYQTSSEYVQDKPNIIHKQNLPYTYENKFSIVAQRQIYRNKDHVALFKLLSQQPSLFDKAKYHIISLLQTTN